MQAPLSPWPFEGRQVQRGCSAAHGHTAQGRTAYSTQGPCCLQSCCRRIWPEPEGAPDSLPSRPRFKSKTPTPHVSSGGEAGKGAGAALRPHHRAGP